VPNTGGIAITAGLTIPLLVLLGAAWFAEPLIRSSLPSLAEHIPGLRDRTPEALSLLGCVLALHIVGLVDDRRPMPAIPKLAIILGVSLACVLLTGARLLSVLDPIAGGSWLSIALTVLWFGVVINAFNFMDNMDALAGGCASAAALCFCIAAGVQGQLFVSGTLALLLGAVLGFLWHNRPPARIFMGDGGSLVIGLMLAFLTVRTTYYQPEDHGANWHAVLTPLVILAVPLYDFVSVTLVRLRQGANPMKGDTQHFSHRLRRRGLRDGEIALIIAGLTLVTGVSGIVLGSLAPWQAWLIGAQTLLLLAGIALFEMGSSRKAGA